MTTIRELLARAGPSGDRPALLAPGRPPLDSAGLAKQAVATAAALNGFGIGAGDRVALLLPNGPEAASAFLAVAAAAASAPLNPAYRAPELEFYLTDLGARALIVSADEAGPGPEVAASLGVPVVRLVVDPGAPAGAFSLDFPERPEAAGPARRPAADDVALVLHTSGTTSRPKIVPLAHRNLLASARNIRETLALSPADRCLNVMPLFHIHGLMAAVLATVSAGAGLVATPGFDPEHFFPWMEEFAPTWYTAVPTMHQAILARAGEHAATVARRPLRFLRSSSASMPPTVLAKLEETFGAPLVEAYGMTEAAHQMASNPLPPRPRKAGTVGPAAGPEVGVMDGAGRRLGPGETGEVVIRGENVFSGYESNREANAKAFSDGWFRTGDEGSIDADGYLRLTGRLKEIINRGGEKVSPREIDEVLLEHPGVAQALAFAIPDPRLGEEIGAVVVRAPGSAVTSSGLLEFAADRLADFKLPRRFLFRSEIPKGPTGKLRRIGLAEVLGVGPIEDEPPPPRTRPRTETERRVAAIFEELLGLEEVGAGDHFFGCGGDSLLAVRLAVRIREALSVDLPPWVLLDRPRVAELAAWIETAPRAIGMPVTPRIALGEPAPLAPPQRALWYRERLSPGLPVDHRPTALRIRGPLEPAEVEAALAALVARHPVLGATFPVRDGAPVQIEGTAAPALGFTDLSERPAAEREPEVERIFREDALVPFDLETGPVLRARLLRTGPTEHVLALHVHHVVFDGWSVSLVVRDLAALVAAARAGSAPELPALPIRYVEHAARLAARLETAAGREGRDRAADRLADAPRSTLPGREASAGAAAASGAVATAAISPGLRRRIEARSRRAGATPFTVLFTAFSAFLRETTEEEDLVVGTIHHGRTDPDTADLVGLFMNAIPVRTDLRGARDFDGALGRTREALGAALSRPEVPIESLVRAGKSDRSRTGQNPFFDLVFQVRSLPPSNASAGGTTWEEERPPSGIARMDLLAEVEEDGEGYAVRFEYPAARFDGATVASWAQRFVTLLDENA